MRLKPIYMDNNATTQVDPWVAERSLRYLTEVYANPSSSHRSGREAHHALDCARKLLSKYLNVQPNEIYFTSGATESNNIALRGCYFANKKKGNHIITTSIEHASIRNVCETLRKHQKCRITYLPVDRYGRIRIRDLLSAITPKTILISIMGANNEIGTILPLKTIGKIAKRHKILYHIDATQIAGKYPFDVQDIGADLVSLSAHKFHGPKGVGLLIKRNNCALEACSQGGGHERYLRPGTENVAFIWAMAHALQRNVDWYIQHGGYSKMKKMRNYMERNLKKCIPNLIVNGHPEFRMVNTLSICIPGIDSRKLIRKLDKFGLCVNTGSACSQGKRSRVLEAIGVSEKDELGALRISLSRFNTMQEAKKAVKIICKVVGLKN